MLYALVRCVVAIVFVMMAINGAFMLVSPRAWFRLPGWLRAQWSLAENEYSTGWGAVHVRLTGGFILAIIAWATYEWLSNGGASALRIWEWAPLVAIALASLALGWSYYKHTRRRLDAWAERQGYTIASIKVCRGDAGPFTGPRAAGCAVFRVSVVRPDGSRREGWLRVSPGTDRIDEEWCQ